MDADLINYIKENIPQSSAQLRPAGRKARNLSLPAIIHGIRLWTAVPGIHGFHQTEHPCPRSQRREDSGIVAIPHLSRDLLACYDGNGSNFGTHPQNVLRE